MWKVSIHSFGLFMNKNYDVFHVFDSESHRILSGHFLWSVNYVRTNVIFDEIRLISLNFPNVLVIMRIFIGRINILLTTVRLVRTGHILKPFRGTGVIF
jgi:hypothetical protein